MSLLSKLQLVTVDVTGTLIAYRGQLGDYYCMAAKSAGMPCPDYKRVHEGFKVAYAEMTRKHPCFGHASSMPNVDWWKMCVKDSIRSGAPVLPDLVAARVWIAGDPEGKGSRNNRAEWPEESEGNMTESETETAIPAAAVTAV